MSRFGRGSFRPGQFGLGRFGLILGWVVSAYFGGSFRPDIPPTPPPICYNINEFSFMISHTIYSLCSAAVSKESYKVIHTIPKPIQIIFRALAVLSTK